MKHGVRVVGVGMTPVHRRDQSPHATARAVAAEAVAAEAVALADAGLAPRVDTGGIISRDPALVGVHIPERA